MSGSKRHPGRDIDAAAISVVALEKFYGGVHAVNGLSFEVERGEVFGLLGPNGAGKTTTVEILEGYRRRDGGSVSVLGLDPERDHGALCAQIGVMLQEGGLYPGLSPLELLTLFAAFYEDALDPRAMLEEVGLHDSRETAVRRLSGGQSQRLSLACALIGKPRLVFLDEPTAGMDPHARATTWAMLRSLREQGTTIVLTTHLMDEAEQLCDRLAIISGGRLAAIGSPRELTHRHDAQAVSFTAAPGLAIENLAAVLAVDAAVVTEERPGEYCVRAPGTPALIADIASWMRDRGAVIGTLQAGGRSLEEVFLQITAEQAPAGEERAT